MAEGVTALGRLNGTAAPPDPVPSGGEEARRVLQMIITVVIFTVGIALNGLVVWVLGVRGGRREGQGREVRGAGTFRMYVVNLALADLVLLLRTPLMLGYLANHYRWPFSLGVCQLIMFLRGLGLYANAFLLCAISAERCLCLLRPVWFRLQRPGWTVPFISAVLWLVAAGFSTPYFFTTAIVPKQNPSHCIENDSGGLSLMVIETLVGFILPLLLFLSSNVAVMVIARQAGGGAVPTSPTATPPSKRLTRLYHVLFLTVLLFLTCWVPYFIFRFLVRLSRPPSSNRSLFDVALAGMYVSLYLVYAKSALNPMLYVFAARGLSRTVRASIFSAVDRIFNEDTSDYARRRSLRRADSQI